MFTNALSSKVEAYSELVSTAGGDTNCSKVSQLDAFMLDNEVSSLLRTQLQAVAKYSPRFSRYLSSHPAEVNVVLRGVLWAFSHRRNLPSPGEALQNLRWRNERFYKKGYQSLLLRIPGDHPTRRQRVLQLVGTVFVPFFVEKWRQSQDEESEWIEKCYKLYQLLSLVNVIIFYYQGKYYRLIDRILGMRLVFSRPEAQR